MVKRFEYDNGTIFYINDNEEFHREDGPAAIYPDGDQYWFKNGKKHRDNGPAMIFSNGDQYWFKNDRIHREDGPAVIRPNGEVDWCLDGHIYSFKKWCEVVNISDEEKMELALKYG